MKLLTKAIKTKLEKNFQNQNDDDVVLKLFGGSSCTWLITQIEPDGDIMWGLADIGMGCCEYGTISLSELESVKFPPFSLGVERDRFFRGGKVEHFQKYYDEHNTLNGC
jgi:hypothetical protein